MIIQKAPRTGIEPRTARFKVLFPRTVRPERMLQADFASWIAVKRTLRCREALCFIYRFLLEFTCKTLDLESTPGGRLSFEVTMAGIKYNTPLQT
jgi:hypothetical protein